MPQNASRAPLKALSQCKLKLLLLLLTLKLTSCDIINLSDAGEGMTAAKFYLHIFFSISLSLSLCGQKQAHESVVYCSRPPRVAPL